MKQSQKLLLTWLIENTGLYHKIKKYIAPKDFTEEIYHKVAEVLFQQFEESGEANPAKIVSMFPDEEAQKEVAALFNARIHEVESKEDREKALKGDPLSASNKTVSSIGPSIWHRQIWLV